MIFLLTEEEVILDDLIHSLIDEQGNIYLVTFKNCI